MFANGGSEGSAAVADGLTATSAAGVASDSGTSDGAATLSTAGDSVA